MATEVTSRTHRPPKEDRKPIALPPPYEVEEDTDSEDDEDEEQNAAIAPSQSLPESSAIQNNGSDSNSDLTPTSDSGASPSDYIVQPIPKPLNIITTAEKRSHAEMINGQQSSSKSSKKPKPELMEKKPAGSTRAIAIAWSNDDEVTLLRGMDDFKNLKGLDPKSDLGGFYNSIKGGFRVDFSKEQVRTKIKNLRNRFVNAMKRSGSGSDPVFSKPHDCLVFELSKKVWGDDEGITITNGPSKRVTKTNSKRDDVKEKKIPMVEDEKRNGEGGSFWSKYLFLSETFDDVSKNFPSLGLSTTMKDNMMSVIRSEEAKEMDDKCKQLFVEEMELKDKQTALVRKHLKGLLDL